MDGAKVRIEQILNRVEQYRPDWDEELLRRSYVFAANRHQGQVRRSGEAYLIHPLTVAWILADMELDEVAIAAGLLRRGYDPHGMQLFFFFFRPRGI